MVLNDKSGNTVMRIWLLMHQANDLLSQCEEEAYRKYGLTPEQWRVLARLKFYDRPLGPGELAETMCRSSNSLSMLVDRMVKAGLVKRTRDKKDRRMVNVTLTSKGESAVTPATPEGWKLIQEILSPLSSEDREALANMLETVKCEAFAYLHPEMDKSEVYRTSGTNDPNLHRQNLKNLYAPALGPDIETGRRGRPCPDLG